MKIQKAKLQEFKIESFKTSPKKIEIKGGSLGSCNTDCQGWMTCAITRCHLH